MMKNLLLAGCVLCLCACSRVSLDEIEGKEESTEQTAKTRNVQFVLKGLDVEYSGTRATVSSEGMTDLYVWEGSTLLKHQTSTDADFGAPTVSLTIGAHDLTFVASKSDGQSWSDGVWLCSKVKDTYGAVLTYTVSSSSSSKQVELTRCNGMLEWTVEDEIPTTVTTVSFSVPQCFGLDAGLNGVLGGTYENTVNIVSKQGKAGYNPQLMVLPVSHADGGSISATIGFDNGVSYTTDCVVGANVITNIHGEFFSAGGGLQMVLTSDWGEQTDVSVR